MTTIARMLTRMVIVRFLMIIFGISSFVITLDVFTNADDILQLRNGKLSGLAEYALLRLPGTLSDQGDPADQLV